MLVRLTRQWLTNGSLYEGISGTSSVINNLICNPINQYKEPLSAFDAPLCIGLSGDSGVGGPEVTWPAVFIIWNNVSYYKRPACFHLGTFWPIETPENYFFQFLVIFTMKSYNLGQKTFCLNFTLWSFSKFLPDNLIHPFLASGGIQCNPGWSRAGEQNLLLRKVQKGPASPGPPDCPAAGGQSGTTSMTSWILETFTPTRPRGAAASGPKSLTRLRSRGSVTPGPEELLDPTDWGFFRIWIHCLLEPKSSRRLMMITWPQFVCTWYRITKTNQPIKTNKTRSKKYFLVWSWQEEK